MLVTQVKCASDKQMDTEPKREEAREGKRKRAIERERERERLTQGRERDSHVAVKDILDGSKDIQACKLG